MSINIKFSMAFEGSDADRHLLDFYDAADALKGFQRSLALTTQLILHGEIITEAPSLRGARILIKSPEAGSWKVVATVGLIMSGAHQLGTAPRDTVLGNLVTSAYDYVVKETLGFHVDFDSTLGQQYEDLKRQKNRIAPEITQSQMDSLIEKTENSVLQMHRPIHASKTAEIASLKSIYRRNVRDIAQLDSETYDYVKTTTQMENQFELGGRISSYNINTYKGRIFIEDESRPVPFVLAESARDFITTGLITSSLRENDRDRLSPNGRLICTSFKFVSSTGRLKSILITNVDRP